MSSHTTVQIGNTVRVRTQTPFTDAILKVPAEPTVVQLEVIAAGSLTTYTYGDEHDIIQKVDDSFGDYYADIVLNVAGRWLFAWIGTGALVAANQGLVVVTPRLTA